LRIVTVFQRQVARLANTNQAIPTLSDTRGLVVSSLDADRTIGVVRTRVLVGWPAGDSTTKVGADLVAIAGTAIRVAGRTGGEVLIFTDPCRGAARLLALIGRCRAVDVAETLNALSERAVAEKAAVAVARAEALDTSVATLLAESTLREARIAGGHTTSCIARFSSITILGVGAAHVRLQIRSLAELSDTLELLTEWRLAKQVDTVRGGRALDGDTLQSPWIGDESRFTHAGAGWLGADFIRVTGYGSSCSTAATGTTYLDAITTNPILTICLSVALVADVRLLVAVWGRSLATRAATDAASGSIAKIARRTELTIIAGRNRWWKLTARRTSARGLAIRVTRIAGLERGEQNPVATNRAGLLARLITAFARPSS
jgi:hypothetical protein